MKSRNKLLTALLLFLVQLISCAVLLPIDLSTVTIVVPVVVVVTVDKLTCKLVAISARIKIIHLSYSYQIK